MPSAARRQRAHETETVTARWFAANGWPYAEPVGAGRDGTDVTGLPGLLVEVKARREFRPVEWLRQHALPVSHGHEPQIRNGRGVIIQHGEPLPFVVWRPDGMGPVAVGSWGVMMRLDDFTSLLHEAGYGTET